MISLENAQKIAINYFNEGVVRSESQMVIIPNETIEYQEGYIFSANTKKYIIEGDEGYRVSGLSPVLVVKKNGEIFNPYINQYIYSEELISLYRKKKK